MVLESGKGKAPSVTGTWESVCNPTSRLAAVDLRLATGDWRGLFDASGLVLKRGNLSSEGPFGGGLVRGTNERWESGRGVQRSRRPRTSGPPTAGDHRSRIPACYQPRAELFAFSEPRSGNKGEVLISSSAAIPLRSLSRFPSSPPSLHRLNLGLPCPTGLQILRV
ncbi:hypothetical protein NEUTE2DRAFT_156130 [Neurospora tetrasperma FGSC 2509]|nr:hypothetical protein NEUTE2DRAFT_156130 [Neurospora tetrasperma FGSC 2509]